MEVEKGYKQTDVGVIPDDWELKSVGEIAGISTGTKNTQDRIDDGLYPFFVRSQTVERINSYSFDGEAVLTAGDGVGTGKVFHYIHGRFDYHQRVYSITNFNESVVGYFFFLYFSNNFYNRIMQMTAKSSVDSVRMEMIAKMKIPLPPYKEQTAIATALSDADALISRLEKLIAKKCNIKQGAMQLLLQPKEGWKLKKFKDVLIKYISKDFQINSSEYQHSGQFPVIDQGKKPIIGYSDNKNKLFKCPRGGIIIFGDHTRVLKYVDYDFVVGADGTQLLSSNENGNTLFYYYLLCAKEIPNTGYNRHFKFLLEMDFIVPKKNEQNNIAEILNAMDIEIAKLENKLEKYKQIKQGMMQQLLTGKIRLV